MNQFRAHTPGCLSVSAYSLPGSLPSIYSCSYGYIESYTKVVQKCPLDILYIGSGAIFGIATAVQLIGIERGKLKPDPRPTDVFIETTVS